MQVLIRLFIEVALHRKGPQDVPASGIVFALALTAYLAIGAAVLLLASLLVTGHILRNAMDWSYAAGVLAAVVYFALSVAMFRRYFPVE